MNYLTRNITSWLCKQGAIVEEDKELYEYATYCFLITISPLIMALIYSAIIGGVRQYIAMLIPFMYLRQYCGGYHAKKAWICMVLSFLTLVLMVQVAIKDTGGVVHWLLVILACFIIVKNSPIDSENYRLSEYEKILYHKKAVQILIFFLLFIQILDLFSLDIYANSMGIGIILVSVSQIPCLVKMA